MKKFFLNLVIFVTPLIFFFGLNEHYCRTETDFAIKKSFLEKNVSSIEALVLGSSHSQNGVNPAIFEKQICNLAFGGQTIAMDYFLFDKYVDELESLEVLIFELSPHRFYNDHDIKKWNGHVYSNLYNIDYKTTSFSLNNYSLVISNPKFFISNFIDYLNPFVYSYDTSPNGFVTNYFNGRFSELNYDSNVIEESFSMRHSFTDKKLFQFNSKVLKKLFQKCMDRNVRIIGLSAPFYKSYNGQIPVDTKKQVDSLIDWYVKEFGMEVLDYSKSSEFNIHDYINDDHLNPKGAKKLSLRINEYLQKTNAIVD